MSYFLGLQDGTALGLQDGTALGLEKPILDKSDIEYPQGTLFGTNLTVRKKLIFIYRYQNQSRGQRRCKKIQLLPPILLK